jgi:integrase
MRKTLTDKGVQALKAHTRHYAHPDPETRGLWVRIQPSGRKSFVVIARNPSTGRQIWTTIGAADVMTIAEARDRARDILKRIRAGLEALEAQPASFADVAAGWLKRHVHANQLRSEKEIRRILSVYVLPRWRDLPFRSIRRADVTALIDAIEDTHGERQGDAALGVIRRIMVWFQGRDDDYNPPIAKGMRRVRPAERARSRILDDDEIRAVWAATASGSYGALVRLLLLTAQRREKVAAMKWDDLSADGVWTIPVQAREKGAGGALKLPQAALDVIAACPRFAGNPYVLAAARGGSHLTGFSMHKLGLDARLAKGRNAALPPMPQWQLHDLRRAARSLMSRCGIRPDISERVLGHVQPGVQGIYDRHEYFDEKADALNRLARLIEAIVHPRGDTTVIPLRR